MKSIKFDNSVSYSINKSTFVAYLFKVFSVDEVNDYLFKIKEEFKDAKHICYAYIVDNTKRYSDDFEPKGTAGLPILGVLSKNELNYCLAIVVRFMYGPKLGSSTLLRSYVTATKNCLNENEIVVIESGLRINFKLNYEMENTIDKILENEIIIKKEYQDVITYTVDIHNDKLTILTSKGINYEVIRKIYL